MADRIAACSKCGSRFKVPPTFKGTKAKCKKCGEIIAVPPLEAEVKKAPAPAPTPAPAAAAAAKPKKEAGALKEGERPVKVSASARARRTRGRGAKGGRRRGDAEEEKSNNMMWIGIVGGVSIVAIIIICIMVFGGNGDELKTTKPSKTVAQAEPESGPEPEPEPKLKPEPEPEPEPEPPAIEIPEEPKEINPRIAFDPFPPVIGCSQERFDRLTECFREGIIKQELPPRKRKQLKAEFEEAMASGFEVIPVFLNGFNGLNLLKREDIVIAYTIASMWNDFTGKGYVDLAVRGDPQEELMKENLEWNYKAVTSMINLWNQKYMNNEINQQEFFQRIDVAREKQEEKAAEDEEEE